MSAPQSLASREWSKHYISRRYSALPAIKINAQPLELTEAGVDEWAAGSGDGKLQADYNRCDC